MQADAVLQAEACTESAYAGSTVMLFMYRWTQTNSPIQTALTTFSCPNDVGTQSQTTRASGMWQIRCHITNRLCIIGDETATDPA